MDELFPRIVFNEVVGMFIRRNKMKRLTRAEKDQRRKSNKVARASRKRNRK